MSGGGGSGGGTQTQVSKPFPEALPFVLRTFEEAQKAFENVSQEPFQGQLTAAPSPLQLEGLGTTADLARGFAGSGQPIIDLGKSTAAGDFLLPGSNPALQPAIDAALRPVTEQFTEQLIPALFSEGISSNAFGGTREDLLKGAVGREFGRATSDTAAKIVFENFVRERALQTQAPQLIAAGQQLELGSPQLLSTVGAAERGFEQEELNEAFQQFNLAQAAPFAGLEDFARIIAGAPGSTTTVNTPGPSGFNNVLTGALGGGLTGLSLLGATTSGGLGALGAGAALSNPLTLGGLMLGGLAGGVL